MLCMQQREISKGSLLPQESVNFLMLLSTGGMKWEAKERGWERMKRGIGGKIEGEQKVERKLKCESQVKEDGIECEFYNVYQHNFINSFLIKIVYSVSYFLYTAFTPFVGTNVSDAYIKF